MSVIEIVLDENILDENDFIKLNMETIEECLNILESSYKESINNEKFKEAEIINEKIKLYKKIANDTMKKEAKIMYINQENLIKNKYKEEIDIYNENSNNILLKIKNDMIYQKNELINKQKDDMDNQIKNFEIKFYEKNRIKLNNKYNEYKYIKQSAIENKNYEKAEEANLKMEEIYNNSKNILENKKEKDFKLLIEKIIKKNQIELNVLEQKQINILNEFTIKTNKDIEVIHKKYKAKLNELKILQNKEYNNIENISKGVSNPSKRIETIIHSITPSNNF